MAQPRIVLAGVSPKVNGLQWESESVLRIGRQASADIFLDDPSVFRQHAEVVATGPRWVVRDLANQERYATLVNGVRVGRTDQQLRPNDLLQCGSMTLKVATLEIPELTPPPSAEGPHPDHIRASGVFMKVQAKAQRTWEEALEIVTLDQSRPTNTHHLLTLLRTGFHVGRIASLDELLRSILTDAIKAVQAQRGSILLADPTTGVLKLIVSLAPGLNRSNTRTHSQTLAERCFKSGESILCRDANTEQDLRGAQSVQRGAMASIICARCVRRAARSACCSWTAARSRTRSTSPTSTWPTPWPQPWRSASRAPSWSSRSATSSCRR